MMPILTKQRRNASGRYGVSCLASSCFRYVDREKAVSPAATRYPHPVADAPFQPIDARTGPGIGKAVTVGSRQTLHFSPWRSFVPGFASVNRAGSSPPSLPRDYKEVEKEIKKNSIVLIKGEFSPEIGRYRFFCKQDISVVVNDYVVLGNDITLAPENGDDGFFIDRSETDCNKYLN